jgi:hypothetical protein
MAASNCGYDDEDRFFGGHSISAEIDADGSFEDAGIMG